MLKRLRIAAVVVKLLLVLLPTQLFSRTSTLKLTRAAVSNLDSTKANLAELLSLETLAEQIVLGGNLTVRTTTSIKT